MENLMDKCSFSTDEKAFFINLYQGLSLDTLMLLDCLKQRYLNPGDDSAAVNMEVKEKLAALAETVDVHPYSMHMLFLLLCAPEMVKGYIAKGWDVELAYNLLMDLRYKLTECEKCTQIIGTMTFEWFHRHFLLNRFALGYFQYDPIKWDLDMEYHFGDVHVKKGDPVYKIHIPSAGKMTREKRLESYCAAHDFFGFKKGEPVVLYCRTWFLYEGYQQCYPEGSNLRDFRGDYDIIEDTQLDKFHDAWRIFNCDYDGDTSALPRDTSLQRNFISYIENGGNFGVGAGIIICDGERILNNQRDNA